MSRYFFSLSLSISHIFHSMYFPKCNLPSLNICVCARIYVFELVIVVVNPFYGKFSLNHDISCQQRKKIIFKKKKNADDYVCRNRNEKSSKSNFYQKPFECTATLAHNFSSSTIMKNVYGLLKSNKLRSALTLSILFVFGFSFGHSLNINLNKSKGM